MNRKRVFTAILATAALALGSGGTAWAHESVTAADEQCGALGDQTTPAAVTTPPTTPADCGAADKGQTAEQAETPDGQPDVQEGVQEGVQLDVQEGVQLDVQTGDQQEGEH